MIQDESESSLIKDLFEKLNTNFLQFNELIDSDIEEDIQNTFHLFQEYIEENDFEFFSIPLSMLSNILDDRDSKESIVRILMFFESFFPIFFSLVANFEDDSDFYQQLIVIITYITAYLDYSKFLSFISNQFIQGLSKLFINNSTIINIIKIIKNIFSVADFDFQKFIISEFSSFFNNLPDDEDVKIQFFKLVYVTVKCHKFDEDFFHIIYKLIDSFIKNENKPNLAYHSIFFSIGNLINDTKDAEPFMKPEFITIYNECLYSTDKKILNSLFFVLSNIINNLDYDNFYEIFDYEQAVNVTFDKNQDEIILFGGLDFLISSAACGIQMQKYLHEFDLFSMIEERFDSSTFKVRSNLSRLYINLVPRNDFEVRIDLLKSPFFENSILQSMDSYDYDIQKSIINIVYHTLLKAESFENNEYHLFLIESDFISTIQQVAFKDDKYNFYANKIIDILEKTENTE